MVCILYADYNEAGKEKQRKKREKALSGSSVPKRAGREWLRGLYSFGIRML
jgi:hypothetical protein